MPMPTDNANKLLQTRRLVVEDSHSIHSNTAMSLEKSERKIEEQCDSPYIQTTEAVLPPPPSYDTATAMHSHSNEQPTTKLGVSSTAAVGKKRGFGFQLPDFHPPKIWGQKIRNNTG